MVSAFPGLREDALPFPAPFFLSLGVYCEEFEACGDVGDDDDDDDDEEEEEEVGEEGVEDEAPSPVKSMLSTDTVMRCLTAMV